MSITTDIKKAASNALQALYPVQIKEADVLVNVTKPEFEGDYTIVLFAFVKSLRKSPEVLGKEIGEHLMANEPQLFSQYNVIKGFLNLTINDAYWLQFLSSQYNNGAYGSQARNGVRVMVESSSPNTNKPLHLGHLRNNFLGWSTAEILKACGNDVVKTCVVNDRGIHICKSMIAWQWFGNGATPESTGLKGDHLVGDYYVVDFFYPPFSRFLPIQTFRYAACGGANMLFDICLYAISYNFIFQKQNVHVGTLTISPYIAAFFTAFCISFPTGFYLSRYVVFQESSIRGRIQLLRYFMVVVACFFLNYIFLKLFIEYFGWYPTPSKIVTTVVVVVFSFISQSYFSFGTKRKTPAEQSM